MSWQDLQFMTSNLQKNDRGMCLAYPVNCFRVNQRSQIDPFFQAVTQMELPDFLSHCFCEGIINSFLHGMEHLQSSIDVQAHVQYITMQNI